MSRIIYYRNSFLPRIRGEVRGEGFETTVEVRMNLHPLVWVFLAFWVGILGMMSLFLIPGALAGGGFDPFILMPPGMVLFAYAITLGGFKHESKKSRQFLAELLEAEAAEASR
ncbi:MAG: hypothetical protein D6722_14170 [Bacteroidetes bacterium]|nr:MAG: hypothetical protein D6722_14170 [Bacteroidota bacterium]